MHGELCVVRDNAIGSDHWIDGYGMCRLGGGCFLFLFAGDSDEGL
jgi:hypothetical protein